MPLRVLVDGAALPEADAKAMWQRFSAWMDEHKGDLGGFARAEGLASVHPELHGGEPVLVASRTATQRPYTSAPTAVTGKTGRKAKPPPRPRRR